MQAAHLNVPLTDTAVCPLLCHVGIVTTRCLEVIGSKAPHELLALDNQDTQMSNVGPRTEYVYMCGVVVGVYKIGTTKKHLVIYLPM